MLVAVWASVKSASVKAMAPVAVTTPSSATAPEEAAAAILGASLVPVMVTVTG